MIQTYKVPSVEKEGGRRIHRERERLIKERIQHLNRIKALLATQGNLQLRTPKA